MKNTNKPIKPGKPVQVSFEHSDFLVAVAASIAALLVYLLTLAPTVSGEDSGELVTAAYFMGIAHPPGYPVWCMFGKLFTFLPIGEVAWRVNFMSSAFAASTVGLCTLIGIHLFRNRLAAVVGALAFAFSREFWEQSVIAEVYSLNAFFIALCVLLLLRWQANKSRLTLFSFAFAYGLSLGNHNTMVVLTPVFGLWLLYADNQPWLSWKVYALALLIAVLPLSAYLYLPIRSAANPPVDWGNPETWSAFWAVVTRKQYTFMFTENPRSIGLFVRQCMTFGSLYLNEFTPWLTWAPLVGAYCCWKRSWSGALLILGVAASVIFSVIIVNNFAIEKEDIWVNNVFWIPVYMCCGIMIAGLVDALGRSVTSTQRRYAALGIATIVLVVSPLAWNYRHNDKSEYYFARDYATNMFVTVDENSIIFPTADHATFPCIYLQAVDGVRPDVLLANKYGYPEMEVYADMPEEQRKAIGPVPNARDERVIEQWAADHFTDRPIYFSTKRPLQGAKLVPAGLLFRVVRDGETPPTRDYFSEYHWTTLDEKDTRGELTAEMILADVHFAQARTAFEKGNSIAAIESVATAMRIEGLNKESLNNAGSLCAENGAFEAAVGYFTAAMEIDPEYEATLANLGRLRIQLGDYKGALPLFETMLSNDPLDPEANWLAYECLKGQVRIDDAFAQLKRMSTFPYDDPKVYRELGMHYLNNEQRPDLAKQMFVRSLQLNPDQEDLTTLIAGLGMPGQQNAGDSAQQPGMEDPMAGLIPNPAVGLPEIPQVPGLPGGAGLPAVPGL